MAASIHWDLTQQATRRYLRDDLFARLTDAQRMEAERTVAALGLDGKHCHDIAAVDAVIDGAFVSERVKRDAKAVYALLAEAEASVHGVSVDQTHFHEVGNGEAVANVLAVALAVEALDPDAITATKVQIGCGKVQCTHGLLDIPAPATAAILARGISVCEKKLEGERCTPTSAALIAYYVQSFD